MHPTFTFPTAFRVGRRFPTRAIARSAVRDHGADLRFHAAAQSSRTGRPALRAPNAVVVDALGEIHALHGSSDPTAAMEGYDYPDVAEEHAEEGEAVEYPYEEAYLKYRAGVRCCFPIAHVVKFAPIINNGI